MDRNMKIKRIEGVERSVCMNDGWDGILQFLKLLEFILCFLILTYLYVKLIYILLTFLIIELVILYLYLLYRYTFSLSKSEHLSKLSSSWIVERNVKSFQNSLYLGKGQCWLSGAIAYSLKTLSDLFYNHRCFISRK